MTMPELPTPPEPPARDIHESHSMRTYSDIPWGCWLCGACDCHHMDKLQRPCDKGIRQRKW